MTPAEFVSTVLDPGLAWCASIPGWAVPSDDRARVLLTAISGQEANWSARKQANSGPARGLFQFERRGGVAGVLNDDVTADMARAACAKAGVAPNSLTVWRALETNDRLAVAFARLLLWTEEAPLPEVGDIAAAWKTYSRLWRPGAPSFNRWQIDYPQALAAAVPIA